MLGALLVGVGALSVALAAGALLDAGTPSRQGWPRERDTIGRVSLQMEPPPRCCG